MEIAKLALIFALILVLIFFKLSLSAAVAGGAVLTAILYQVGFTNTLHLVWQSATSWSTLSVILICYMITFLQRLMELQGHLDLAQTSLSGIFNSRRVNASIAPIFIGLLPSPGAAFIAGDMVKKSCAGYLDNDEQTFVTSYFRHIPESCLPTYSCILLALQLSGVETSAFMLGMLPMVVLLVVLGFAFYLRKVPRDTGLPPAPSKGRECLKLLDSMWAIALSIVLILAFNVPVYAAVGLCIVLYFLLGVCLKRIKPKQVLPFFISAFELRIVVNTFVVMAFKEILTATGVINTLSATLSTLPIQPFVIFMILFFVGTIVSGSTAIVALGIPLAFAAVPGAGMPLLVLLMCCTYAAMQLSPTHICLTLIAEYFNTNLGVLVKKTIPVIAVFYVVLVPYYLLLEFLF